MVGSLTSTFVSARRASLAVKQACAFARPAPFPSELSLPYKRLRYHLGNYVTGNNNFELLILNFD